MASNPSNTSVEAARRRPLLRNKHLKDVLPMNDARRTAGDICKLSPEAQMAMKMTQEEAKENMSSSELQTDHRIIQDGSKDDAFSNKVRQNNVTASGNIKDYNSNSTVPVVKSTGTRLRGKPHTKKNIVSSFGASILTSTARSRSTLSLNDRNYSISDNTESCYNYNSSNVVKGGDAAISNVCNKDNECEHNNNTHTTKTQEIQKHLQHCDDPNSKNNIENIHTEEIINENEQITLPKSFVLALDRVLEQNLLSRLKGDITNTTKTPEPGQVRALDGGRLTNAQEVVVNVCHDDDRELVFHDDDEESLNNAKAISEIRISLWMKYNENFQPDDVTDDICVGTTADDSGKLSQANEVTVPSMIRLMNQASRERTVNKPCSARSHTVPRNNARSTWPATKTDPNNNNITTAKAKSGNSNNPRNMSSTRIASNNRFDGSSKRFDGSSNRFDGFNRNGVSSIRKDRKL